MFFYRIPSPNEAFVLTGSKGVKGTKGTQFRIVTGKGCFVFPWKSRARSLSLDLRSARMVEPCVTSQGITLQVEAIAAFKVGDGDSTISAAARRFLDQQGSDMDQMVGQVLAGHLRSIIGGVTVEDIIGNRAQLAQEVKEACSDEMEKMGLVVDSFQIKEITDSSGYIDNLAAPHVAEVESKARIAKAQADQRATEQEQEAAARMADFRKDSEVQQAQARAATQTAQAEADQAGPLAQATAQQKVVEEQTQLATKEARRREAELVAEVVNPAKADADATKIRAQAEAEATQVTAAALEGGNLDRIIATKTMEILPDVVRALAEGLAGSNLAIVNGTEGLSEMATGLITQALAIKNTIAGGVKTPVPAVSAGARVADASGGAA